MIMRSYNSQSGNVVVWALLAIALFGALSYAISSGSRTSTSVLTDEQARTYARQIQAYANDLKQAVKRLDLRGCSDTQISFQNERVAGYTNGTAPATQKCHIFHVNGAGLQMMDFPSDIFTNSDSGAPAFGVVGITGDVFVTNVGTDCANDSCNELVFMLSYVKPEICAYINRDLGLPETLVEEVITDIEPESGDYFTGSYDYNGGREIGDDAAYAAGQAAGCVGRDISNGATYYNVLLAR